MWDDRAEEHVARVGDALEFRPIDLEYELERYGRRLDDLWLTRLRVRRTTPIDPTSPADFVDLSEAEYERQRRLAAARSG